MGRWWSLKRSRDRERGEGGRAREEDEQEGWGCIGPKGWSESGCVDKGD
jgi:hypothetical protein